MVSLEIWLQPPEGQPLSVEMGWGFIKYDTLSQRWEDAHLFDTRWAHPMGRVIGISDSGGVFLEVNGGEGTAVLLAEGSRWGALPECFAYNVMNAGVGENFVHHAHHNRVYVGDPHEQMKVFTVQPPSP